ncbi:uncharacterized protein LOC131939325 isoform X2 [Physella acuta]|uniref:uncharacterized protein LOC131939325 isoform X2 n=1 Tax=Physella acuta TaxID=109671 RepID=UPI0027DDA9EC|nr:uncharacterized protein LOC131939325 isoform X2 [Physella acuta]
MASSIQSQMDVDSEKIDEIDRKLTKIKKYLSQDRSETKTIYLEIPLFMRTRLAHVIDYYSRWQTVADGCERNDPESLREATRKFQEIEGMMNAFIFNSKNPNDNAMFMINDRNILQEKFGKDHPKFMREMARCLQNEADIMKELEMSGQMSPEPHSPEDVYEETSHSDDYLKTTFIDEIDTYLKKLEELDKYREDLRRFNPTNYPTEEDIEQLDEMDLRNRVTDAVTVTAQCEAISKNIHDLQTVIRANLNMVHVSLLSSLQELHQQVARWRNDEARFNVGVGPEIRLNPLIRKFHSVGEILKKVPDWFSQFCDQQEDAVDELGVQTFEGEMRSLLQEFMELEKLFLSDKQAVVLKQPNDVISIENERDVKKKEKDEPGKSGKEKKKKEGRSYCTKKNQTFETTVRLLGCECLQNLELCGATLDLVAEKDLAQTTQTGLESKSNLKFEWQVDKTPVYLDVTFKNVTINNFFRVEQNNVYKQFFRLIYTISLRYNGHDYTVETLSLPFMFNTGSNQILELIGAKMWYCANSPDLYSGSFQCPDSLSVDEVVSMLDNRVKHLSKKHRALSQEEKQFLASRLPSISGGRVTMQGFIKDKMKKTRKNEDLPFSFYTWFHAVIYSLKNFLLKPWLDGIIYGFCSEATARQILEDKDQAIGTFILRPSISSPIKNMSSRDATAALTMDVKMAGEDQGQEAEVVSVPIMISTIQKNTLFGAVTGIKSGNETVARFLYTPKEKLSARILKDYKGGKEPTVWDDYQIVLKKLETVQLSKNKSSSATSSPFTENNDDGGSEPSPRKRPYQRTQSRSSQSARAGSTDDSSNSMPAFNMLNESANTGNQWEGMGQRTGSQRSRGQRSGGQLKPGVSRGNSQMVSSSAMFNSSPMSNSSAMSNSSPMSNSSTMSSSTSNFKYFGTTAVDTTNLPLNGLSQPDPPAGMESESLMSFQLLLQSQNFSQEQLLNQLSFSDHQSTVGTVHQGTTTFSLFDINQPNLSVTCNTILPGDALMLVEYSPDSGISADSPPPQSSPFNLPTCF